MGWVRCTACPQAQLGTRGQPWGEAQHEVSARRALGVAETEALGAWVQTGTAPFPSPLPARGHFCSRPLKEEPPASVRCCRCVWDAGLLCTVGWEGGWGG